MTGPSLPDTGDLLDSAVNSAPVAAPERRIALVDLLDRVLAGGVVLTGEVTISIAGVDLVHVSLRALITSVSTLERGGRP
ncbi:gas vesicle protein [Saccharomonospora cyanea]|uniref:Gas vesicle protein n=1 Tax=Saccharomonospora cyanea NA-134 TaxID=882082 RepID=H5XLP7_9PSEU|nr:gas vesicle protein [Saccharomonospora cyanea]EHR60945.1 Gas vesicle protein [Saccharomonospora cyanea NA-134]